MSSAELTRLIDPDKTTQQAAVVEGTIPVTSLVRFSELLFEPTGEVQVRLSFDQDPERRRVVEGELSAPAVLQCQRCLKALATTLTSSFRVGLVSSDEQAKQLPGELEPFQFGDNEVDVWQLVEDELLLVVPPFPLHDEADCEAAELVARYSDDGEPESAGEHQAADENPFNVLAELKKGKDS
ncbi:hypothetical protein CF392_00750 [Tamilnaduibacter salinus]|uniref:Large ribosomal RNA subunit accumulation protein YceD n=1 Tax=Tamilnaduibacter salinus TaxID=1484056 RepID=A0A2A2I7V3_9GAMM|nr:YceD family protein [Tamilnaduibacter salinus]PAV27468.1 hypothetical protein CF392_00750 [Tamilnaduibacter salinus]